MRRVWRFGDNVTTDAIIPGRYLESYDPDHLAAHAMEGASRTFAKAVSKGDIIVAGSNFGCGSSREQAVISLAHAGIDAVVARSFSRIFYRNAVNLGLPVIISENAFREFADGETVSLNLEGNVLESADGSRRARLEPVPEHLKKILDAGGLVPYIKSRLAHDKSCSD